MKRVYKIKAENTSVTVEEFKGLPLDLTPYTVAYVGKHRSVNLEAGSEKTVTDACASPHLLIECRLFNENEEIFIYPRNGKLWQRVIKQGDRVWQYVDKEIQLRNEEGHSGTLNDVLVVRHYLNPDLNGFAMMRFLKLE